jgi:hypothetical protein
VNEHTFTYRGDWMALAGISLCSCPPPSHQ